MAVARFAWGIDIGNRALKAVKLIRQGDRLKIDDFDVVEHEQILSNAGDNRESYIANSVATFAGRHQLRGGAVALGVSGQASFARFIKLPPVERRKILEIVRFEAIQQIPFPLEEVEWSHQLFESPESPDIEVGIFAMRKELVSRHLEYFSGVDMNITAVQMNPLAVYNAMYFDDRLNESTMIIDMGAENTDLIIGDRYGLWHRSISIGGNAFTEALVKAFKLDFAKAEDLKRNAGTSKYTRQIFTAMRPVFADLVSEIQRSMGFFASVHRESRIARVIALGGTFRLPNLQRYVQQNLQMEVVRMDNFGAGSPSDPKQAAVFNENLLSLAGAYGLGLQAMGEAKVTSSLLPASIRRERLWREKTKWFGLAAAMFVVGTGLGYASMYNLGGASNTELAAQNDRAKKDAQDLSNRWGEIESGAAPLLGDIKQYGDLMVGRTMWAYLLKDIHDALPTPQQEVIEGYSKLDPALVKRIPRTQREQITVSTLHSIYASDLQRGLSASEEEFRRMVGAAGAGMAAAAPMPGMFQDDGVLPDGNMPPQADQTGPSSDVRGFLITVTCTTPFSIPGEGAYKFMQEKFIDKLLKINAASDPLRRYEVKRAVIVKANMLRDNPAKLAEIQKIWMAARQEAAAAANPSMPTLQPGGDMFSLPGMPPGGMPPMAAGGGVAAPQYLDVLTDEDVTQDSEFTILFAVVVHDKTVDPAAPK
jgi:type IV pilus assembly protein PilM